MSGIVASLSGSGVVDDQKPVAAIGIAAGIFLVVTIFTVFSIWRRREALKASAFCPCIRGEKGIDDMTPEELKAMNPYSEDYEHLAPAIPRDPEAAYVGSSAASGGGAEDTGDTSDASDASGATATTATTTGTGNDSFSFGQFTADGSVDGEDANRTTSSTSPTGSVGGSVGGSVNLGLASSSAAPTEASSAAGGSSASGSVSGTGTVSGISVSASPTASGSYYSTTASGSASPST